MLSQLFMGLSLLGAEWVLIFLVVLSIFSIALILERTFFYFKASQGLSSYRTNLRTASAQQNWKQAFELTKSRQTEKSLSKLDLETEMVHTLLTVSKLGQAKTPAKVLEEFSKDVVMRTRLEWERNLSILATIGNNAPFVGLFGTVLGIIKAFHDLSKQAGGGGLGAQGVTAGISEALVATAVGILVAIPAVVAYNLFQRKVKSALTEAEALKSFLIGNLGE